MNEKAPEDCIGSGEDGSEHGGRTEEFCNSHNYTFIIFGGKYKNNYLYKVCRNSQMCVETTNWHKFVSFDTLARYK